MKWFVGRFYYAFQGFQQCVKDHSIFLQMIFGCIVFLCGIFFHCSKLDWVILVWSIGLVIAAEIFNSCIEGCVDYISLKKDSRAKKIKDMAASAVFVISFCAAISGLLVFVPKIV